MARICLLMSQHKVKLDDVWHFQWMNCPYEGFYRSITIQGLSYTSHFIYQKHQNSLHYKSQPRHLLGSTTKIIFSKCSAMHIRKKQNMATDCPSLSYDPIHCCQPTAVPCSSDKTMAATVPFSKLFAEHMQFFFRKKPVYQS